MTNTCIVIVSYRRTPILKTLLNVLASQLTSSDVIVLILKSTVDQSIMNKNVNLTKILIREDKGLGTARSIGAKICIKKFNAKLIIFIDDDAIPDKNWIKELKVTTRYANIVGGPCIALTLHKPPNWWFEEIASCHSKKSIIDALRKKEFWRYIYGCNFAVRREVFEKCGYFEPLGRFKDMPLSGEETQFILRAIRCCNAKVFFNPNARVYHIVLPHKYYIRWILRSAFYTGISRRYIAMQRLMEYGLLLRIILTLVRTIAWIFLILINIMLRRRKHIVKNLIYLVSDLGFLISKFKI